MMNNNLKHFVIITPCYNESNLIISFLERLEVIIDTLNHRFTVIVVDDGSTDNSVQILNDFNFISNKNSFKLISLFFNMGHQNAIKQGFLYVEDIQAEGYIVMDSDGEDDLNAIKELVTSKSEITFVTRGKRSESIKFKIGYFFYKTLFKIISGNKINFGNYTMVSRNVVIALVNQNFIHYSAFLSKLKYTKSYICFDRMKRIDGQSKMNTNSLVIHGLNSLIEYSEELLLFFIKILLIVFVFMAIYEISVFYNKFISHKAVTGWASTISLSFIIIILIISSIITIGLLLLSQKQKFNKLKKYYKEIF